MSAFEEYIPRATADKLATDYPKGTRHRAKVDIALPLIGNGMSPNAVAVQLHEKFPEATEKEINNVIDWAVKQNPQPCTHRNGNGNGNGYHPPTSWSKPPEKPKRSPVEQCDWWTSGARETPCSVLAASPIQIPEDQAEAVGLAFLHLYKEGDFLNIVCKYTVNEKGKANPLGGGRILTRDEWIIYFRDKGVPHSEAGAWFRINPTSAIGTGKDDSVTNDDVVDFNYLLVEADNVPVEIQLAVYRRLKLPIAAIVMSGGKSAHSWVKLNAPNAEKYKEMADRVLSALQPFGIDKANGNCSRLSRLPGAPRQIQAVGECLQRLIWLNSSVPALTDSGLTLFEESLQIPAIEEKPLRALAQAAIPRYREMMANVGRLGVRMGIGDLDALSGGMKAGQTIVVSGKTGGGKTTLGLHIINTALTDGHGVLLFSLEMDREEIFDLMVANRCQINRNKFNNGRFHESDLEKIGSNLEAFENLPLYIDDSPMTGVEQVRLRVAQLRDKIKLVVVDYIQFVNPEWTKEVREQQVALISHKLRAMARETRLPFVILSQLNDEGKLRESRVISHNANVVMNIEVEEQKVSIEIIKGRGIPTGTYHLHFDRLYNRLLEVEDAPKTSSTSENEPEIIQESEPEQSLPYAD